MDSKTGILNYCNTIRKRFKLNDKFIIDDEMSLKLEIPKYVPDDEKHLNDSEIWTFCKYDRDKEFNKEKRYLISTFGRLYDLKRGTLKECKISKGWTTASGIGYRVFNLTLCGMYTTYNVHRLVALAFIPNKHPKRYPIVNHIDENPAHNYVWNLEWVDKSTNAIHHNMFVKQENGEVVINTKWTYEDITNICKMMAEGHKATYIYHKMLELTNNDPKVQYERVRTICKHIMNRGDFHDIAVKCGVEFTNDKNVRFLKESGSLKRKESIKN